MKANLSYMLVYKHVILCNKLTDQPSGLENYFFLSVCVLCLFQLCYLSHNPARGNFHMGTINIK